jgi:acylphosphatase
MADYARAHVIVSGRVQGVYYRAGTRDEAMRRGLAGWVKNLSDGKVEAVFEGPKDKVGGMLQWCAEGPPGAEVTDVDAKWEEYKCEFRGFNIIM